MKENQIKNIENKQLNNKRTNLNSIDSFKCFLYSLVVPVLFSAAYTFIVMMLSYIFKIDYEVFTNHWLVKGCMYILNSAAFLCIFLYYYKKNNISFNDTINIKTKFNAISIVITIALAFVLVFGFTNFINLVDYVYELMGYAPSGDLPLKLNTLSNTLISIVLWALLPAICEELLFRGIIFKGLTQKFKPLSAILLGGTMFMLMHGSLQQTVYQLVLGVVLCIVYYYTQNIFYPILLHFLNNAIVIFMGFLQNESAISFNSAWSYIWPILVMLVAVGATVCLIIGLRYNTKNKYGNAIQTEYEVFKNEQNNLSNKWFIASFVVGIVFWVSNTVAGWFGY